MRHVVAGAALLSAILILSCEKKEEKPGEVQQKAPAEVTEEAKTEKMGGAYALADKKGCFACHDVDRKKVGPAYIEVAKRYAGKENALEQLVESITKGSMGKWGSIPMTPQPVTQEEARELAQWILSLKEPAS